MIVRPRAYVATFAALIALTALTIAVSFANLGPWNPVVALSIACAKGTLVALVFMHVRWSAPIVRVFMCAGVLWLGILIALTMADVLTRTWQASPFVIPHGLAIGAPACDPPPP